MLNEEIKMDTRDAIMAAVGSVEHPAIAATLVDLGMVRDVIYNPADQGVALTLVLPFANIVEDVRNYMVNSLYIAIKGAGGELQKVTVALMTDEERERFLQLEQENWRQ
jgi:metal-sulfur cluster biosynthetic enzyme